MRARPSGKAGLRFSCGDAGFQGLKELPVFLVDTLAFHQGLATLFASEFHLEI
jgi:hypothetical protein